MSGKLLDFLQILTGTILPIAHAAAPSAGQGWLPCDGSAVSRSTYDRLFSAIGTTWGAGDGSTTFNVPDLRGRVLVGAGTGTTTASGVNADVDTSADTLTVASNNTKWITGKAVVFTLASGTITGLTSGNTYYIIRASSTTVKLASSLANAVAGTAIDMTAKSSPVWTITESLTARTVAEKGGEESHATTQTEMPAHTHLEDSWQAAGTSTLGGAGGNFGTRASGSAGSSGAHNTMPPFAALYFVIKT